MRSFLCRILLKIFELCGCIACVITKALTDQESRRVFLRNQKFSREWGLLHNITWSTEGNAFANVTYGGFTLITTLMLISRCIDAKSRPNIAEKIFLTVGMLCFCAMGGLVLAAFDQVPDDLQDNSIILGCLSFFVALIMLIDLADPMPRHITDTTQTENNLIITNESLSSSTTIPDNHHQLHNRKPVSNSSEDPKFKFVTVKPKNIQTTTVALDVPDNSNNNTTYTPGDDIDYVQTKILPVAQQPVFEKLLLPDKQRPIRKIIPDLNVNYDSKLNYVNGNGRQSVKQKNPDFSPSNLEAQSLYNNEQQTKQRNLTNQIHGYNQYNQNFIEYLNEQKRLERYERAPSFILRDYSYFVRSNDLIDDVENFKKSKQKSKCKNNNKCSSDDDNDDDDDDGESNSNKSMSAAMRPGFVANAAKMWDSKIRNYELNTIV